ncbi:hypothetical protein GCM10027452_06740 [Micromonospora halotolerans]
MSACLSGPCRVKGRLPLGVSFPPTGYRQRPARHRYARRGRPAHTAAPGTTNTAGGDPVPRITARRDAVCPDSREPDARQVELKVT